MLLGFFVNFFVYKDLIFGEIGQSYFGGGSWPIKFEIGEI